MKIVWLSWKDRSNPASGGAESVSGNIQDRLIHDGHELKLVTAKYPGSKSKELKGNFETIRIGNRYTVYVKAKKYYTSQLMGWADVVIDEMNTIPFISASYTQTRNVLLCYQLAREVWLYQMTPPLSYIGYLIEPMMLRYIAKKYPLTITESKSTQNDMSRYGFKNIHTFRVGMDLEPVKELPKKANSNIVLSLGSIRPMKRTLDAVKAFEIARDKNNSLRMIVAGNSKGGYAKKVVNYINVSRHKNAITIRGQVSDNERLKLMREASVILVTSIKEGWGLIVTEASSQGTPAIVYDVDGLRDSVKNGETGVITPNGRPIDMGKEIVSLLKDSDRYASLRMAGWSWSKEFTHENSYNDFFRILSQPK